MAPAVLFTVCVGALQLVLWFNLHAMGSAMGSAVALPWAVPMPTLCQCPALPVLWPTPQMSEWAGVALLEQGCQDDCKERLRSIVSVHGDGKGWAGKWHEAQPAWQHVNTKAGLYAELYDALEPLIDRLKL